MIKKSRKERVRGITIKSTSVRNSEIVSDGKKSDGDGKK